MSLRAMEVLNEFDHEKKKQLIVLTEDGELARDIVKNAAGRRIIVFETKEENNTELLLNKIRTFDIEETMIMMEKKYNALENAEKLKNDGFVIKDIK